MLEGNLTDTLTIGTGCEIGCSHGADFHFAQLNVTRGGPNLSRILAYWNATTPASETLTLRLVRDAQGPFGDLLAKGNWRSPLGVDVPVGTFRFPSSVWAYVDSDERGTAMAVQNVHIVLRLEYLGPVT